MKKGSQQIAGSISSFGCTGLCYTFVALSINENFCRANERHRELEILRNFVAVMQLEDVVADDCYIKNPEKLLKFVSDREDWKVYKLVCNSLSDTKGCLCLVEYCYLEKSHFCVAYDGKIIYNPLPCSNVFREGSIKSMRLIETDYLLYYTEDCIAIDSMLNPMNSNVRDLPF